MKFAYSLAIMLTPILATPVMASTPPKSAAAISPAVDAEMKAASVPVENYIRALETGNADYARMAFHKDARMIGNNRAGFISMPIEEWMKGLQGKPSDDEAQRKRSFRMIELTPTTGVARVDLAYPEVNFVDYMTLLKVDGEWKIINKLFHAERPQAPTN